MNFINYSFNYLHEFAVPTKNSFKDVIGEVVFGEYKTLVMTATAQTVIGKNTYQTIQGYILVKPLAEQFLKKNYDAKMRQIGHWGRSKNSLSKLESEMPCLISILGSSEIKGTYFRPDIVLDVIEWLCPAFKYEIHYVYENHVVEQNAINQARVNALYENNYSELSEKNVRFLDEYVLADEDSSEQDEAECVTLFEIEYEIEKLKKECEEASDIQQYKAINSRIHQLMGQQAQLMIEEERQKQSKSYYSGVLYYLYDRGEEKPFYVGITDYKAKANYTSEYVRFDGHIRQCIDILRCPGADYLHLRMIGKMMDYAYQNGIAKKDIKPSDFFELFYCKAVISGISDRETLEQFESEYIQKNIENGCNLMNMKKNKSYGQRSVSRKSVYEVQPQIQPVPLPNQCNKCGNVFKRLSMHKCKL